MNFLEQQRIPTKVCKKKARDAERNVILYVGRLKTPLSLNIQYNLPKFPRIAYSFTTGSQLHLDSHSIFNYFIPPHPRSWDHKSRRWFYHSAPNTSSAHTGHTGGLVVAAMIVLLWLYSFYRWVALSTLSTQDLLRENCPHCAQIASSR